MRSAEKGGGLFFDLYYATKGAVFYADHFLFTLFKLARLRRFLSFQISSLRRYKLLSLICILISWMWVRGCTQKTTKHDRSGLNYCRLWEMVCFFSGGMWYFNRVLTIV